MEDNFDDIENLKDRIVRAYSQACYDYYLDKVRKREIMTGKKIEKKDAYLYAILKSDEEENKGYFAQAKQSNASQYIYTKKYGTIHVSEHRKRFKVPKLEQD